MKKLLILIIIVFNLGHSYGLEYKPDYPIVNNLSGFNLNVSGWNWYPNNKEWREMDVSEVWLYLSYYSKNKYTLDYAYARRYYFDDIYQIDLSYNTVPFGMFVNRNGITYTSEKYISAFTTLSYNLNILKFISINYLIGEQYGFKSKKNNLVNILTLNCGVCKPFDYYFSYWMWGRPKDDEIWLSFGVNIFLDKKLFFTK